MERVILLFTVVILLAACEGRLLNGIQDNNNDNEDNTSLPNAKFVTSHFTGSKVCAECHNDIQDQNGVDVSIEKDWSSTLMANAARDPFFRAKMASEIERNSGYQAVIEEKCSRCHMPMANVQSKKNGEAVLALSPGFLAAENSLFDAAMDGVSCTLCHQIENSSSLGEDTGFSGNYSIGDNKIIYGPFQNPHGMPMQNHTGFQPQYSSHMSSSKLCSSCHNLFTDVIDINTGQLTGAKFPEQTIYTEWENSQYAQAGSEQSCQDCHMPETNGVGVSSQGIMMNSIRDNFSRHYFVGGNTFMLDILNRNKSSLAVAGNNFETTIERTREMLSSAASLSIGNANLLGNTLSFTVTVKNNSGHKLPSGYPSRRVWLHITVKDSNNTLIFESGGSNNDGSINGVDADENDSTYEKHHDLITQDNDVQVYESIMGDTNNQVTYTLLHGANYLKDNRLLPLGFNKQTVPSAVQPASTSNNDNNFIAATDAVTYQINTTGTAPYTVEVELNYQSISYRYAQDLFRDGEKHEYVKTFESLYEDSNIRKETIATLTQTIQ